jgi:hypothetical protein
MEFLQGGEVLFTEWVQNTLINGPGEYGAALVRYTEQWAGLMESALGAGGEFNEVAVDTHAEAMLASAGNLSNMAAIETTMEMQRLAVAILSTTWAHGDKLYQWWFGIAPLRNPVKSDTASFGYMCAIEDMAEVAAQLRDLIKKYEATSGGPRAKQAIAAIECRLERGLRERFGLSLSESRSALSLHSGFN